MSDTKLEMLQKNAATQPDNEPGVKPEIKADSQPSKGKKPATSFLKDSVGTPEEAPKKLLVEKRFDKAVYGGISYAGQAGTGILVTNWLTHGKGLKNYERMAKWTGKNVVGRLFPSKTMVEAVEASRTPVIVSTMIVIGNLFLIPVKMLENRKVEIIRKMNEKDNQRYEARGFVLTPEEKQAQDARLQFLEKEPKQSWKSLGSGRAFGLAAVYATLFALDQPKKINNKAMEVGFSKTLIGFTKAFGFKKLAKSKPMENYTRIAFYDIFYSAISAGGLYMYSHFIEPPKKEKKAGDCEPCPSQTTPIQMAETEKKPDNKRHFADKVAPKEESRKPDEMFVDRVAAESAHPATQVQL